MKLERFEPSTKAPPAPAPSVVSVDCPVAIEEKYLATGKGGESFPFMTVKPTMVRAGDIVMNVQQLEELQDDVGQGKLTKDNASVYFEKLRAASPRLTFAHNVAMSVASAAGVHPGLTAQVAKQQQIPGCVVRTQPMWVEEQDVNRDSQGGVFLKPDLFPILMMEDEFVTTPQNLLEVMERTSKELPAAPPQAAGEALGQQQESLQRMRSALDELVRLEPSEAHRELQQRLAAVTDKGPLTASDLLLVHRLRGYSFRAGGDMEHEERRRLGPTMPVASAATRQALLKAVESNVDADPRHVALENLYVASNAFLDKQDEVTRSQPPAWVDQALSADWVQEHLQHEGIDAERAKRAVGQFMSWSEQGAAVPPQTLATADGRKDVAAAMILIAEHQLQEARQKHPREVMEAIKAAVASGNGEILKNEDGSWIVDPQEAQRVSIPMSLYVGKNDPFRDLGWAVARGDKTTYEAVDTLIWHLRDKSKVSPAASKDSDLAYFRMAALRSAGGDPSQIDSNLRLGEMKETSDGVLQFTHSVKRYATVGRWVLWGATVAAIALPAVPVAAAVALGVGAAALAFGQGMAEQADKTEGRINRVLSEMVGAAGGEDESGLVGWLSRHASPKPTSG